MSSSLAFKLAELLKECELRDEKLHLSEKAITSREAEVEKREREVLERETSIRAESAKLDELRNVSAERQRTQDMIKKHSQDVERFDDLRQGFAREQAQQQDDIRKLKIELEGAMARTKDAVAKVSQAEETLRNEKIQHHERVLKELALIEQKKMELVK
jgi:multidrug resistance efflux pump